MDRRLCQIRCRSLISSYCRGGWEEKERKGSAGTTACSTCLLVMRACGLFIDPLQVLLLTLFHRVLTVIWTFTWLLARNHTSSIGLCVPLSLCMCHYVNVCHHCLYLCAWVHNHCKKYRLSSSHLQALLLLPSLCSSLYTVTHLSYFENFFPSYDKCFLHNGSQAIISMYSLTKPW